MKHCKHPALPRPKNAENAQKRRKERKSLRSVVKVFADGLGVDVYYGDADTHILTAPFDGVVKFLEGEE